MASFSVTLIESLTLTDSVSRTRTGPNLGVAPKQVKALLLNSPDDRQGISLSWGALADNAAEYEVYRSGAVVQADLSGAVLSISNGDTLDIIVRGGRKQTITFGAPYITSGAATVAEIVDNINAYLTDATAFLTYDTSTLYIRPNNRTGKGAKIQVTGGTANSVLLFPTDEFSVNTATSAKQKIATLNHPDNTLIDRDGTIYDFYYVQAVSSTGLVGQPSFTKTLELYADDVPTRTIIYGTIVSSDGKPTEKVEVVLRAPETMLPSLNNTSFSSSHYGISREEAKFYTDNDGYFECEAVVGSILNLYIPDIKYNYIVQVPPEVIEFTQLSIAQENLNTNLNSSFFFFLIFLVAGMGLPYLGG